MLLLQLTNYKTNAKDKYQFMLVELKHADMIKTAYPDIYNVIGTVR